MDEIEALFGGPLEKDPAASLVQRSVKLPKIPSGPVHGAQFVIEIAGPKSAVAAQARALLSPQLFASLGQPEVWAMAPGDQAWRPMSTTDGAGSYDSIAMSWDILARVTSTPGPSSLKGGGGSLSTATARHLLGIAEGFAQSLGRRAFPFPATEEIDRQARALEQARESFDVGVELFVQGSRAIPEKEIWRACAALGMDLAPDGTFVWKLSGWDGPLLQAAPVEEGVAYSLASVKRAADHEAVSVGFNIPTSPSPLEVLDATFHAAEALAFRLGAQAYDEDGHSLNAKVKIHIRRNVSMVVESLTKSGLPPGSAASLKLFR